MNRRDFIRLGALGLTGLTLADANRAKADATRQTSVVWLWLGGGITHSETFDPKPDAPVEFRGVNGAIQTNVSGIEIGANFERLATVMDKLAIVRSFSHTDAGHSGGTHYVMTGYDNQGVDNGGTPHKPGIGSILARYRGANSVGGLPTYVKTGGIVGDGPNFLGPAFAPFDLSGEARRNLNRIMSDSTTRDRRNLRNVFDNFSAQIDRSGVAGAMDAFEQQAFGLLGGTAAQAFDISRESQTVLNSYGNSEVGRNLLTARRLCESGVGFVTIHSGGWDMHSDIQAGMNGLTPPLDRAITAFINDIHSRSMQENVLLVISGEFGRTPRINGTGGRDHWPLLSTLALSGGGMRMGQVIGESSDKAEQPRSRPIGPQDLMATIFQYLGMPLDLQFPDLTGRPTYMIDGGRVINGL